MQYDLWWIWCLFLVIGFGGCLGSFMNVVVYRLPRDIGLRDPLWSYCPTCHAQIRGRHNIPVLSYFLLRGRCAACHTRIPARYPVGEILMMVVFLLLFDAFFLRGMGGITSGSWSVAYRFYADWPIFAAHAVLFGCLLGMSAIDLEAYWVDIRFTQCATIVGFLAHAAWTPPSSTDWPRPTQPIGMMALAATLSCVVTWMVTQWWRPAPWPEEPPGEEPPPPLPTTPAASGFAAVGAAAILIATIGLIARSILAHRGGAADAPVDLAAFAWRTTPAIGLLLVALLGAARVERSADGQIEDAIEAERPAARGMVLRELVWLLPTIAAGVGVFCLADHLVAAWTWKAVGHTQPLRGLGTAAAGFVLSGGLAWSVRIGFTLLLGKEAFGLGDVHIMAAAGAVVGWQVVLLGFFLSAFLALFGWLCTLRSKNTRTVAMGPWLTLGIFVALLYRDPLFDHFVKPFGAVLSYWFPALEVLFPA